MTVKNVLFFVKVFAVLVISKLGCHCQEVGSPCKVEITGEPGICKIAGDCPAADEQAKQRINPTICGFHQLIIPIFCCENPLNSIPSPNDLAIGNEESISFPSEEPPNLQGNSFFSGSARKSEQKCLEYTRTVTNVVHALPLVTNIDPIGINVTNCEYNSVALIVGGSPAAAGEFPFMAAIGFPDSDGQPDWRCGGSLISDKWVLTAAHCTFSREGEPKWIRLGELDKSRTDDSEHRDYDIHKMIVHPEYKYPQKYNDIALVSTTINVKLSKFIRPACLNTKSTFTQKVATAAGWGQTDFSGPNSDKLLKVQLNIYNKGECTRAYRNENKLSNGIVDTMLCAGELKGGMDTCLGDSGGPLFITEKGNMCKFYIVGVTSFGKLCAQVNTPAIYTKVSEYIDWIENTIW